MENTKTDKDMCLKNIGSSKKKLDQLNLGLDYLYIYV